MPRSQPVPSGFGVLLPPGVDRAQPGAPMEGFVSKAQAGFVPMEYLGEEDKEDPILAPSGRAYTFGTEEDRCRLYVHPMDVNYLRALGTAKLTA